MNSSDKNLSDESGKWDSYSDLQAHCVKQARDWIAVQLVARMITPDWDVEATRDQLAQASCAIGEFAFVSMYHEVGLVRARMLLLSDERAGHVDALIDAESESAKQRERIYALETALAKWNVRWGKALGMARRDGALIKSDLQVIANAVPITPGLLGDCECK